MTTPSPNLPSSRKSSSSSDLVSLSSSSDSEVESLSGEADHHRSNVNADTHDLPPPTTSTTTSTPSTSTTTSTPSRQRNSSSQSASVLAAVEGEGPVSESPVVRGQLGQSVRYELFDPDQLTQAEYENKGLLYAKSSKAKFNM